MKDHHNTPIRQRENDGIARLLRLLPEEPTAPSAVAERARAAAEAEWHHLLLRRGRRRRAVVAGTALAAALLLAFGLLRWRPASLFEPEVGGRIFRGPTALVEAVHGPAEGFETMYPGRPLPSGHGDVLDPGTILTTAAATRVALRLGGGESLRLDVDSRVELVAVDELRLERGAIYIDSEKLHGKSKGLLIHTPLGTATNLGTQFEMRLLEGSLRVRVREGRVRVDGAAASHEAAPGAELTIDPTGAAERRTIPVHGLVWRWQLDAAPPFRLEGRTLAAYLAWLKRETGWRLRFAIPYLEDSATTTVLHGTLEGLAPDQTPDLVLPTCGLRHRLEDGVLILSSRKDFPKR